MKSMYWHAYPPCRGFRRRKPGSNLQKHVAVSTTHPMGKAVQAVQRQAEAAGAAPRLRPTPQTRDIEAPPVE